MKFNKKIILTFFVFAMTVTSVFAGSLFAKYDQKHFTSAVEKELKHKAEKYEQIIIDSTFLYYDKQLEQQWSKESWSVAVAKAAALCNNKAAIIAAKTGEFGEKAIKAIIQATEEAASSITKWVDEKSEDYDKKKK